MLIIRSQLLIGDPLDGGRALVVALSDTGGHIVRVRREDEAGASVRNVYCGVALRDASAAFTAACREEGRRLGSGAAVSESDPGLERWLDGLAALGELPSVGRPRPRRSIPVLPTRPEATPAPASGVAWQAYHAGSRVTLVVPGAGPAVLAIWGLAVDRPVETVTVTSRHVASPLLAGSSRIPQGSTLDGILLETGERGTPLLVVLDLLRYHGQDLTGQTLATRAALLEQLWGELAADGGVPAGWRWANLTDDVTDFAADEPYTWRSLAATYGAPASWGLVTPIG